MQINTSWPEPSAEDDYDIYAREIWRWYKTHEDVPQEKFVTSIADFLTAVESGYIESENIQPDILLAESISERIYRLCEKDPRNKNDRKNIQKVKLELKQRYCTHCCQTLSETINGDIRYSSSLVYVPSIDAYVLVNRRRYVYAPEIETYMLEQSLKYKLLDYCPFCGEDLKKDRKSNNTEAIINAVEKWQNHIVRTAAKLKFGGYDYSRPMAKILASEWVKFNDKIGADYLGNIYNGADFITINKIFDIILKTGTHYCYEGERDNFIEFYRDNFKNHLETLEEDELDLVNLIESFLWSAINDEHNVYNEIMEMSYEA
ncbi:MAG: hypothetical protein LBI61_01190 [Puniceicoccales bacterium]|nr:hypothetical protein [Puniceicoccales bacterium]